MNAYQKATLLVTAAALPLVLLFMQARGHAGAWMVGAAGLALSGLLVYALRKARSE